MVIRMSQYELINKKYKYYMNKERFRFQIPYMMGIVRLSIGQAAFEPY